MPVVNVGGDCLLLGLSLTDLQRGCKAVALFWLHNPGHHHRPHRPAASPAQASGGGNRLSSPARAAHPSDRISLSVLTGIIVTASAPLLIFSLAMRLEGPPSIGAAWLTDDKEMRRGR